MATFPVKWYASDMQGAPSLGDTSAGALTALLKAVLVTGFGTLTVNSLVWDATENAATAQGTFAKLVTQHQEKLKEWREETAQQEKRLADLDTQVGLTAEQIKLRSQIRGFLDEHRRAIGQSEKSLKEIDALLDLLKKEQETYAAALAEWQGFLAKEHADVARLGTVTAYVTEKLEQVKADDARPRAERVVALSCAASSSLKLLALGPVVLRAPSGVAPIGVLAPGRAGTAAGPGASVSSILARTLRPRGTAPCGRSKAIGAVGLVSTKTCTSPSALGGERLSRRMP